jgi:hypothetical protein
LVIGFVPTSPGEIWGWFFAPTKNYTRAFQARDFGLRIGFNQRRADSSGQTSAHQLSICAFEETQAFGLSKYGLNRSACKEIFPAGISSQESSRSSNRDSSSRSNRKASVRDSGGRLVNILINVGEVLNKSVIQRQFKDVPTESNPDLRRIPTGGLRTPVFRHRRAVLFRNRYSRAIKP